MTLQHLMKAGFHKVLRSNKKSRFIGINGGFAERRGSDLGSSMDIVQTTNYYPFGLVMNQVNRNTWSDYKINKYLYNGKERQDDKMISESLNWYDYGKRLYHIIWRVGFCY